MAQPIYKSFFAKFTESWYQLSKAEQDDLMNKVTAARDKVGGKLQVVCNCNWSSEPWQGFGLEVFPDMEAVQQFTRLLNEMNWFRYIDSFSLLGTELPPT